MFHWVKINVSAELPSFLEEGEFIFLPFQVVEVSWIPWFREAQYPRQNTAPGSVARPELKKQFLEEPAAFMEKAMAPHSSTHNKQPVDGYQCRYNR